jgi:hypothetical protein
MLCLGMEELCSPEYEIWVRHEVRDTFEHTPGLEYKGREGHFRQVHPNSWSGVRPERALQVARTTYLSWDMRERIIEPSFSFL